MAYDSERRWFGGIMCDHLFADCPSRVLVLNGQSVINANWCKTEGQGIDPDGELVCGLCRHRLRGKAKR